MSGRYQCRKKPGSGESLESYRQLDKQGTGLLLTGKELCNTRLWVGACMFAMVPGLRPRAPSCSSQAIGTSVTASEAPHMATQSGSTALTKAIGFCSARGWGWGRVTLQWQILRQSRVEPLGPDHGACDNVTTVREQRDRRYSSETIGYSSGYGAQVGFELRSSCLSHLSTGATSMSHHTQCHS